MIIEVFNSITNDIKTYTSKDSFIRNSKYSKYSIDMFLKGKKSKCEKEYRLISKQY